MSQDNEQLERTHMLEREAHATRWAELLTALSGSVREQAETLRHVVQEQTDSVAGLVTDQARKAEDLARQQADLAEEAKAEQKSWLRRPNGQWSSRPRSRPGSRMRT
ncbi:MAG: hypothetical protein ABJD68_06270 [Nakamurella sp.]